MAIDDFTTNLPTAAESAAVADPPSRATFKPHEVTVSVWPRRLIIEAIEPQQ